MSVYFYDVALQKKIENWTSSTNLHVCGNEVFQRLVEVRADETGDNPLQLPVLSITRPLGYEILNKNKKPLSYDGKMLYSTEEKSISLNAIPISITYKLDIWTRYLKEADEYMRNLIFNIINFPKIEIEIPYNNYVITHKSAIRMSTDVIDNSMSELRIAPGQFSRLTLGIDIDDAYLWDTRIRDNVMIDGDSSLVNLF